MSARPSKSQKKVNIPTDDSSQSSRKNRAAERNVDNKSEASTSLTGSTCRRRHVIHNSATVVTPTVNRGQSLTESAEWRKNGWTPEPSDDRKEGSTGVIESTEVRDDPRRCYSVNNRINSGDCGYEANGEKQDCDDAICDDAESEDVILTGNVLEDDGMLDHPIAAVTGEILLPPDADAPITAEMKLSDSLETCKLNDCSPSDKRDMEQDVTANDKVDESCCADTSRTEDVAPPVGNPEFQKGSCACGRQHSAENTPWACQDADLLACSESGGFSIGASGEMEYQPDAWVNNVDARSRNGPTIFVKQPSECADDHRCSEERKLYESTTRQSPRLSDVQSQLGRRRVSKTAYQRSQETLAQGIRAHPKLEVRSFGAKENLGISSAESDGELTPNAPDSPRVRAFHVCFNTDQCIFIYIIFSYHVSTAC